MTLYPGISLNNVKVLHVSEVIHLGQCLNENISKFSATKCVEDFNKQCNMFLLTLNMPIHILEMFYFINIVQLFMVFKYFLFLVIVWMMITLHGEYQYIKYGGFHGPFIVIYCHNFLVLWTQNFGFL